MYRLKHKQTGLYYEGNPKGRTKNNLNYTGRVFISSKSKTIMDKPEKEFIQIRMDSTNHFKKEIEVLNNLYKKVGRYWLVAKADLVKEGLEKVIEP